MAKRAPKVGLSLSHRILNNPWFWLTITILGLVSVVGISLHRLNTDISAKQEDNYAYSVIASSSIFNLFVYMGSIYQILYLFRNYYNYPLQLFVRHFLYLFLLLLLSPVSISLAIIGLNHSNLEYKKERSKSLWMMNIASGIVYSIFGYMLFAMAMG